ncbi:unnamed protein product [Caenorhabditis sp. 36 PRJEB53466]|nr:unnamed protein product [Caenorhabditis sp. 36 PRJEB53466]
MATTTVMLMVFIATPTLANILLPSNFFNSRSEDIVFQPNGDLEEVLPQNSAPISSIPFNTNNAFPQQHNRNCFFTPVQCMLPLTDSHKDLQSLHGVYSPTAPHVRQSVDNMLTSPWGYTDLIKRGGDDRFYQWLSRF